MDLEVVVDYLEVLSLHSTVGALKQNRNSQSRPRIEPETSSPDPTYLATYVKFKKSYESFHEILILVSVTTFCVDPFQFR
jgi:hypothetical protein